jgi:hypothetical protein
MQKPIVLIMASVLFPASLALAADNSWVEET